MKIVIIGGTGHVGTYLVPMLVAAGHEVVVVSRQKRVPYHTDLSWDTVRQVTIDRTLAEKQGLFGAQIASLDPEVVIDMICFTPGSAKHLVEALHGKIRHFLHCGTTWVHGHSSLVPTVETQPRHPFGDYGIQKAAIEAYLLAQHREHNFPTTILHPGHIVGPGWIPVNPAANFNIEVYKKLSMGLEVLLPNLGMETLHHVHAADVAQVFARAIQNYDHSVGESFHIVSPQAITLRGYAGEMAEWFGKEANIGFLPWQDWKSTVSEGDAEATWDHIAHSPNCSIDKARRLLGYDPKYGSLEAIKESVTWLMENDRF